MAFSAKHVGYLLNISRIFDILCKLAPSSQIDSSKFYSGLDSLRCLLAIEGKPDLRPTGICRYCQLRLPTGKHFVRRGMHVSGLDDSAAISASDSQETMCNFRLNHE